MTDFRTHLINTILSSYGLDTVSAAARVADELLSHTDADVSTPEQETEALAEELWAAASALLGDTDLDPLLDAITAAAVQAREALAERDDLIRAAMRTNRPRIEIATAAMLKPARLYQIADVTDTETRLAASPALTEQVERAITDPATLVRRGRPRSKPHGAA